MKRVAQKTIQLIIFTSVLSLVFLIFVLVLIFSFLPSEKEIRGCLTGKFNQVYLCPSSQQFVKLKNISTNLKKAILTSEDSSFYQHHGFDFREIQNSMKTNLKHRRYARGGSTITQQLAKNLFLTKEKSLNRKLKEALITIQLEKTLTKDEIFEKYLNVVQFDSNVFGIKAASQHFFNKPASELNTVESAFLAFLLPNPSVYSQSFYKKRLTPYAQKRIGNLLDDLFAYNNIDVLEYAEAKENYKSLFGFKVQTTQEEPGKDTDEEQIEEAEEMDPVEGVE